HQGVALRVDLVPRHQHGLAVHRHVGVAGTGRGDFALVSRWLAGFELAIVDRRAVLRFVPDRVAHAVGADGEAGAVVRTAGDAPLLEGGTPRLRRDGVGVQHGVAVVADVVAVDAAEERGDFALRRA